MSTIASENGIAIELPAPHLSKGEREYQAFLRMLPELLPNYRGRFVAIHDGRLVDSDVSDVALIQRVQQRVGYVPMHVGLVTEEQPVVRIPHYREQRPRGGA